MFHALFLIFINLNTCIHVYTVGLKEVYTLKKSPRINIIYLLLFQAWFKL